MTKSTGTGRGGRRDGAGRKAKPKPPRLTKVDVPTASVSDVEALARDHTALAVAVLAAIALNGEKEAARVAAANSLLDRGHGKPVVGGAAADGKKAQRQANAEKSASEGRFAAPAGPKLVVSNK